MQIVCPHCSTSYGISPAALGEAGRNVRCSRCKEVWLARPEDAVEFASHEMAGADDANQAAEWNSYAHEQGGGESDTPHVDSPSIAWQGSTEDQGSSWSTDARNDLDDARSGRLSWLGKLMPAKARGRMPHLKAPINVTTACAAMGALVLATLIWRAELVRLLPQTAGFYKLVGLDVNLRGLKFKDVKVSSEMVEGKPVLVIEGSITGESNKPVEIPRLRFSVRDAQGAEIYAWNAVLEQSVLRPGERAQFKSRLASPPPEGRNIDVRFFNKRDITGGHA
jgi:predicted Zn finger-like uncharacterized protein